MIARQFQFSSLHVLHDSYHQGSLPSLLPDWEHDLKTPTQITPFATSAADSASLVASDDSPSFHRLMLVFTDGACLNNGKRATDEPGAGAKRGSSSLSLTKVGIGAAAGHAIESEQRSKPVNDTLDPDMLGTNQRAELFGALEDLD
ncbi:hypothetical protein K435DRAFT_872330 [Dendrothele bispora CBS 962.96]|uniref:RNase H type-1 domain-containing protein n=1 Tax=Dendrothele bispora (strain CBS 962.96) TaxID=1314807 RepID=A0A4S8L360_DENBC|nr:hypothetical protein K435DRAFT_872330 [Dendrothele bispora CBS 962.96]